MGAQRRRLVLALGKAGTAASNRRFKLSLVAWVHATLICRFACAAAWPRTEPAIRLAVLSHMLMNGFFFSQGLGMSRFRSPPTALVSLRSAVEPDEGAKIVDWRHGTCKLSPYGHSESGSVRWPTPRSEVDFQRCRVLALPLSEGRRKTSGRIRRSGTQAAKRLACARERSARAWPHMITPSFEPEWIAAPNSRAETALPSDRGMCR